MGAPTDPDAADDGPSYHSVIHVGQKPEKAAKPTSAEAEAPAAEEDFCPVQAAPALQLGLRCADGQIEGRTAVLAS